VLFSSSATEGVGKVMTRRQQQQEEKQQQQQQQQQFVKVVSPQELKQIVARLSRSPGDALPPPPPRFLAAHGSGGHKWQQELHAEPAQNNNHNHNGESSQQEQHAARQAAFRPIASSEYPALPQQTQQSLMDLLPQASHQGLPLKIGSKVEFGSKVGSTMGSAGCVLDDDVVTMCSFAVADRDVCLPRCDCILYDEQT
jgi:hypothetical protein